MILFSTLSEQQRLVLANRKKAPKKALKMIEIANMLTRVFFGTLIHPDPTQTLHVAEIPGLILPWNEKGTHGKITIEEAYERGDPWIALLCEAMIEIEVTCDNKDYESARHKKATNKYGRIKTHKGISDILQKYYNHCGGGVVEIFDDGVIRIQ